MVVIAIMSWRCRYHRFLQGRFKPNTQYTISGILPHHGQSRFNIVYTDGSVSSIEILIDYFEYYALTTIRGKTVDCLRGSTGGDSQVYVDINTVCSTKYSTAPV